MRWTPKLHRSLGSCLQVGTGSRCGTRVVAVSQICSGTMSHDSCGTDTSEDTVLLWHRSSSCIQASGSDTVTVFISKSK